MNKIRPYAKAVVALAVPVVTALVGAMTDESLGGQTITGYEYASAALAGLLTAATVFGVSNGTTDTQNSDVADEPTLW